MRPLMQTVRKALLPAYDFARTNLVGAIATGVAILLIDNHAH